MPGRFAYDSAEKACGCNCACNKHATAVLHRECNNPLLFTLKVAHLRPLLHSNRPRVFEDATPPIRTVVTYVVDGKPGLVIDPDGPVFAVLELQYRCGDRLDWADLLRKFEAMECDAREKAIELIRRIMGRTP